jgi:hypothetical protein
MDRLRVDVTGHLPRCAVSRGRCYPYRWSPSLRHNRDIARTYSVCQRTGPMPERRSLSIFHLRSGITAFDDAISVEVLVGQFESGDV